MKSIAVVVLTLNEAARLPSCLGKIPDGMPVYVIDSGSTDGTVELARSLGASVLENAWRGFAAQRNFAIDNLSQFSWLLFVDADELYTPAFFEWLGTIDDQDDADVWQVSSRICIDGKRLRYAPAYPIYHPRLVRCERARFASNASGHGETVIAYLKVKYVDLPYDHHITADGMSSWLSKHVRLARMEVDAEEANLAKGFVTWRRRASNLVGDTIIRVPLRFFFHYVVVGGFLDGLTGFKYAIMYTWFELTKWLSRERAGV